MFVLIDMEPFRTHRANCDLCSVSHNSRKVVWLPAAAGIVVALSRLFGLRRALPRSEVFQLVTIIPKAMDARSLARRDLHARNES
jgi:hypothetical protein